MNIGKRFADYHRAELERLVAEGFELIELHSVLNFGRGPWGNDPIEGALTPFEFQLLGGWYSVL